MKLDASIGIFPVPRQHSNVWTDPNVCPDLRFATPKLDVRTDQTKVQISAENSIYLDPFSGPEKPICSKLRRKIVHFDVKTEIVDRLTLCVREEMGAGIIQMKSSVTFAVRFNLMPALTLTYIKLTFN